MVFMNGIKSLLKNHIGSCSRLNKLSFEIWLFQVNTELSLSEVNGTCKIECSVLKVFDKLCFVYIKFSYTGFTLFLSSSSILKNADVPDMYWRSSFIYRTRIIILLYFHNEKRQKYPRHKANYFSRFLW